MSQGAWGRERWSIIQNLYSPRIGYCMPNSVAVHVKRCLYIHTCLYIQNLTPSGGIPTTPTEKSALAVATFVRICSQPPTCRQTFFCVSAICQPTFSIFIRQHTSVPVVNRFVEKPQQLTPTFCQQKFLSPDKSDSVTSAWMQCTSTKCILVAHRIDPEILTEICPELLEIYRHRQTDRDK